MHFLLLDLQMHAVGNQLLLIGDARTVPYRQIIIVMSEGAKAALSAFDHLIRREPVEVKEAA